MNLFFKILKTTLVCIMSLILFSCSDHMPHVEKEALSEISQDQLVHFHDEFAKILAKVVVEPEVREFIKQEALKQFDKDYDVLVHLVKDVPVREGKSFKEVLKEYDTDDQLDRILKNAPLLTIFVPDLSGFSPHTWNTSNDVSPLVAIRNVENKEAPVSMYDAKGMVTTHPLNSEPDFPVLVVKENERLVVSSPSGSDLRVNNSSSTKIVTDDFTLEFISEEFEPEKVNISTNRGPYHTWFGYQILPNVDVKVTTAYKKAMENPCSNCYHRDYIYYDIFEPEGANEGVLDGNYEEAVMAIKFNSVTALETAADWTEGNLELYIYAFYIGATSSLDKTLKVKSLLKDKLLNQDQTATKEYVFDPPLSFVTWDMKKYGDRWKFWVYENDPSVTVTKTITHTTEKGSNFELKPVIGGEEGVVKINAGFGNSSTTTHTTTTEVSYTTGSDNLGEAILEWTDPVVIDHTLICIVGGSCAWNPIETYVENTGSVLLSIETIKK